MVTAFSSTNRLVSSSKVKLLKLLRMLLYRLTEFLPLVSFLTYIIRRGVFWWVGLWPKTGSGISYFGREKTHLSGKFFGESDSDQNCFRYIVNWEKKNYPQWRVFWCVWHWPISVLITVKDGILKTDKVTFWHTTKKLASGLRLRARLTFENS